MQDLECTIGKKTNLGLEPISLPRILGEYANGTIEGKRRFADGERHTCAEQPPPNKRPARLGRTDGLWQENGGRGLFGSSHGSSR